MRDNPQSRAVLESATSTSVGDNGWSRPTVLTCQSDEATILLELEHIFSHVFESNWLPLTRQMLVLRLASESQLIRRLGLWIKQYIQGRGCYHEVVIWDGDRNKEIDALKPGNSMSQNGKFSFLSACMPHGVPFSPMWLQSFDLVTIAEVNPDNQLGITGILDGQASALSRDRAFRMELIAEAHRLVRSDVAILCGPVSRVQKSKRLFCAVSNDDIALDIVMARAARIRPQHLPHFRFLASQFTISHNQPNVIGGLPQLEGVFAPLWRTWPMRLWWRIIRLLQLASGDFLLARSNLARIPEFIARRIKAREAA